MYDLILGYTFHLQPLWRIVSNHSVGASSKDHVYDNEKVFCKYDLVFLESFLDYSKSFDMPNGCQLNWCERFGYNEKKLKIWREEIELSSQFAKQVFNKTRTAAKCTELRISHGKRPEVLFFIADYANLQQYCRRRCRVCVQQLRDGDSQALKLLRVLELKRVKQIISK